MNDSMMGSHIYPISSDIIQKIRCIEIYTKKLVSGRLMGNSRSTIKGSGFDFDQIREYQLGDDFKFIDWNSSARMNTILTKQYQEERNKMIMIMVDISASSYYGSGTVLKYDLFAQIAAIFALVAYYNRDLVSLLLFSDDVDYFIPPRNGRLHVQKLLYQLFTCTSSKRKTNIKKAFDYLMQLKRKDMTIFLISDCIDPHFESTVKTVSRMQEITIIKTIDIRERHLPAVGFLTCRDIETGLCVELDLRKKSYFHYNLALENRLYAQDMLCKKYGLQQLIIDPNSDYAAQVVQFFQYRMRNN